MIGREDEVLVMCDGCRQTIWMTGIVRKFHLITNALILCKLCEWTILGIKPAEYEKGDDLWNTRPVT
jgi:hypothetical protein